MYLAPLLLEFHFHSHCLIDEAIEVCILLELLSVAPESSDVMKLPFVGCPEPVPLILVVF